MRVHLAKILKVGLTFQFFDEPTNDLDVDTLRALEGGLENFAGCAVIISHDRWFLIVSPPMCLHLRVTFLSGGSKVISANTKHSFARNEVEQASPLE